MATNSIVRERTVLLLLLYTFAWQESTTWPRQESKKKRTHQPQRQKEMVLNSATGTRTLCIALER